MTNLDTLKRRRAEARAKLDATVAALVRGKEAATAAQAKVNQRATERAAWIERYSRKVEAHLTAGASGPAPAPVADAKALQTQLTDEANAAATAAALKRIEAAECAARADLEAADRAVHAAALAQLGVEAEELAGEIERLRSDLEAKELRLRALRDVPDFRPTPRMLVAMGDDTLVPVNLLRARGDFDAPVSELAGHTHRGAAETEAWQARLAELVSAPELPEPTERAA